MDSLSTDKKEPEINRSVGGLHILPSKNISEAQYSHIRAFVDRAYAVSKEKTEKVLFEGEIFALAYNVSPGTYLSLYCDLVHPLQAGMYYTTKKDSSTVFGRVSQICNVEELMPILLKKETLFAERCKTYLDGWRTMSETYEPPTLLLSAWEAQLKLTNTPTNKNINLKENPKNYIETLRWK